MILRSEVPSRIALTGVDTAALHLNKETQESFDDGNLAVINRENFLRVLHGFSHRGDATAGDDHTERSASRRKRSLLTTDEEEKRKNNFKRISVVKTFSRSKLT